MNPLLTDHFISRFRIWRSNWLKNPQQSIGKVNSYGEPLGHKLVRLRSSFSSELQPLLEKS
jgi:hypothetical protein